MNPRFDQLQSYPFQKLAALTGAVTPPPGLKRISLHIGEPQASDARVHQAARSRKIWTASRFIRPRSARRALRIAIARMDAAPLRLQGHRRGDARSYRSTAAAKRCLHSRRPSSIARARSPSSSCPIRSTRSTKAPRCWPGATPHYLQHTARQRLCARFRAIARRRMAAHAARLSSARRAIRPAMSCRSTSGSALFALSDRYGFVIASDECYSEIYFDEAQPPLGALQAAQQLRPRRLSAARDVLQPLQAIQCAGHALGLRRRRCRNPRRNSCSIAPITAAR